MQRERETLTHRKRTHKHDNGSMQYSILISISQGFSMRKKRYLRNNNKKGAGLCTSFHSAPLTVINTASQLLLSVINEAKAGVWMATLSAWRSLLPCSSRGLYLHEQNAKFSLVDRDN